MDLTTWLRAEWDRFLAVTLIVLGAVALGLGYWGVAHARYTLDGLAFLVSGGLGGLFLLGLGATLLLSADLHDEWRKFDRIEAQLATLAGEGPAGRQPGEPAPALTPATVQAPTADSPLVPAPVLNRFGLLAHDPGLPGVGAARLVGSVGSGLSFLAVAGGWFLAAGATDTAVAVGGAGLAAAGLVVLAAAAAVRLLRSRRLLRWREQRLFGSLGGAAPAVGARR